MSMRKIELVRVGIGGLGAHKLRTFLTALGIIFGVAAVVSMLSIGEGAKQEAMAQFALLGIDNIHIYDTAIEDVEDGEGRTNASSGLSLADVRALRQTNPLVKDVVPSREIELEVAARDQRAEAMVVGTTPEHREIMRLRVQQGRFFT